MNIKNAALIGIIGVSINLLLNFFPFLFGFGIARILANIIFNGTLIFFFTATYLNHNKEDNNMTQEQNNNEHQKSNVLSIGDWMVTLLISAIPFVNLIMMFVWAFDSSTNPNKANWAKASLIFLCIGVVFAIVITLIFVSAASNAYYYY